LNSVFGNIYQLVIGKFFTASSLGFYSRADSLNKYPVTILQTVVGQVTFPVFSKIQDDKVRLRRALQKSVKMITFIMFPLMVGLATVAKPLIIILITSKWLPSVPFFQMLCIPGALLPLQALNLNALNAQGRSDLFLRIILINKALILIMVAITFRYGIIVMIYGQIVTALISYYLSSYYSGKLLNYSFFEQVKDMIPSIGISALVGIFVFSVSYFSLNNQLELLMIQIAIGVITFVVFSYIFKISSFLEMIKIAQTFWLRVSR